MKTLTVSSADLTTTGRWDFGFHALRQAHKARADELSSRFTADEVREMLAPISLEDLAALAPLTRGSADRINRDKANVLIKEYPHLALAAVLANVESAQQRSNEAIAAAHRYKNVLEGLVDRVNPEPIAPAA